MPRRDIPELASNDASQTHVAARIDRVRTALPSARRSPIRFDLLGLAILLALTGAFGRGFSKLELGFSWLHITEVVLVATLVAAAIRTPAGQWAERLRDTRVLVPTLIFWAVGAVAVARGLVGSGFADVLHDVGLIEYSVLLPLLAVLVCDRAAFVWMCRAVALAGLLGVFTLAVGSWTPLGWDVSAKLNLIAAASGMYATIYVAWILARRAAGLTVPAWQYATVALAAGLVVVSSARSAWLGLLVVFACIAALALPQRRLSMLGQMTALLMLGTAVATAAQQAQMIALPGPVAVAGTWVSGIEDEVAVLPESKQAPAGAIATAGERRPAGEGAAIHERPTAEGAPSARPHGAMQPGSLFANPGIERGDVRGYTLFAPNTLAASSERAKSGTYSLRAAYNGDPRLAKTLTYLPLAPRTWYRASAWVYLPAGWDGGAVSVSTDRTWAHAAEVTAGSSTTRRGGWTRLHTELAPEKRDLVGGIHIRTASAPSLGAVLYIDDVRIEPVAPSVEAPSVKAPAVAAAQAPADPSDATDTRTPGAVGLAKLTASFRDSAQQANAEWRLAFWKFILEETAKRPLWGVGFGTPSNFEWSGIRYDSRTGDPTDPFDVTGPHNSFLNVLYRTGLPGFLALVAIMLIAIARIVGVARRASGTDKAIAIWLFAGLAATSVAASLSVALEGPFMGIFFWTILALALIAPRFLGRSPENVRPAGRAVPGR